MAPQDSARGGIHGGQHADIAQGVEQARLVVATRAVKKGGAGLGEADKFVVVVDMADFIGEDGPHGGGEGKEEEEEEGKWAPKGQ